MINTVFYYNFIAATTQPQVVVDCKQPYIDFFANLGFSTDNLDFGCDLTLIEIYQLAFEFISVSGSTQCVSIVSDEFQMAFLKSSLLKSGVSAEDLSERILSLELNATLIDTVY